MSVEVADLQERPLDPERVRGVAESVLAAEGRADAELSVALVTDERIAELHVRFMDVAGPTDVISFPLDLPDGVETPVAPPLGEVVVSTDTAAREAAARGHGFERELLLYVVHGTLHLLGYDDRDAGDRAEMEARQEELLEAFLRG